MCWLDDRSWVEKDIKASLHLFFGLCCLMCSRQKYLAWTNSLSKIGAVFHDPSCSAQCRNCVLVEHRVCREFAQATLISPEDWPLPAFRRCERSSDLNMNYVYGLSFISIYLAVCMGRRWKSFPVMANDMILERPNSLLSGFVFCTHLFFNHFDRIPKEFSRVHKGLNRNIEYIIIEPALSVA